MDYDLAVVGGGLAGSSFALAMARAGKRVIIFEREAEFRDRVRGEGMLPWGAAEARELGVYQALAGGCAHEVRWMTAPDSNRDLVNTSPSGMGFVNFHHPEMQQSLLDAAVAAGAELRRPAEIVNVHPGDPPSVSVRANGGEQTVTARLVVGADGRNSRVRALAGFETHDDPGCMVVAGTLYRGMALPDDAVQMVLNPNVQQLSIIFPIGEQRFRAYLAFRRDARAPLGGHTDLAAFAEGSVAAGASADWFSGAACIGPLASFEAPDRWVNHPFREGVVLIGDAAAASDPVFGCGLSLTVRDARVLRDRLLGGQDWNAAADEHAAEHDAYFAALHRTHDLWRQLFFDVGPAADALRARALPLIGADPSRMVDFIVLGPEAPNDERARRRFFGED